MSLEIIIQEIKAQGYILPKVSESSKKEQDEQITEKRRFRLSFGNKIYISKQTGYFLSRSQLCFYEPYSFVYDNHESVLNIEIFKEHEFGSTDDFKYQLNARVDLSDFSIIKQDYIETDLTDLLGSSVGTLTLAVDVFKKGPMYEEKVVSSELFEAVRKQVEKTKKMMKVTAAGKNIKNLLVNNQLSNTLMTISSMHMIPETEDTQIFNRDCFLMLKYGQTIRVFTKVVKSIVKDATSFLDYLEFVKNQQAKFQFYFFFIDELGAYICKARGQIKYIIFDETITAHRVNMFDKKSGIYGNLMIKFAEKEVEENPNLIYKMQKKIKENENVINEAIDDFNRYKFQAKYNNAVLSQKLRELEIQKLKEQEEKNKPLNPEEKKKQEEHKKFIDFLQKEVLRIQRQLTKKDEKNKVQQRKQKYLPSVPSKNRNPENNKNKNGLSPSQSSTEFRDKKVKLPKV